MAQKRGGGYGETPPSTARCGVRGRFVRYWLRSGRTQYQLLACQNDQAPQGLP